MEPNWRQQLKGVRAFVETLKEAEVEERDTKTIAGKFAEALGNLEDAWYWLRKINREFDKRYPNDIAPDDPDTRFWCGIFEAAETLWDFQEELGALEEHMPKEVTA